MVHTNCVSATNMCALVLPRMIEKRKGVIINMSSLARLGFVGGTTYSATKAYVSKMSECLQRTYKDSGMSVSIAYLIYVPHTIGYFIARWCSYQCFTVYGQSRQSVKEKHMLSSQCIMLWCALEYIYIYACV